MYRATMKDIQNLVDELNSMGAEATVTWCPVKVRGNGWSSPMGLSITKLQDWLFAFKEGFRAGLNSK